MRNELLRLQKYNSTKSERRIAEILKKNHIKFEARARVGKYEVDFLIGRTAIEVDGNVHTWSSDEKDTYLFSMGYVPVHISTGKYDEEFEQELKHIIKTNGKRRNNLG